MAEIKRETKVHRTHWFFNTETRTVCTCQEVCFFKLNRIKDSMTGRQGLSRSRFVFVLLRHSASTFTLANRSGVAVARSGEDVERRAQSCTGTASERESNCWRAGSGCSVSKHTHTHTHTYIQCAFRVSLGDSKQATSCRLVLAQRPGPRVA